MTGEFLYNLVALQGGAIVSANDCTSDEVELAREKGMLAVVNGHHFVYRGKIWMAQVKHLLNQQNVKQTSQNEGNRTEFEIEETVRNGIGS